MDFLLRRLTDDLDEDIKNVLAHYINFEYNSLLKSQPQPKGLQDLVDMNE